MEERLERLEALTIVNMALGLIGAEPIVSGDPAQSRAERTALEFLDTTRDSLLEEHPWNFASVRQSLTQSADPPAFGFPYAYDLPPDFIRLNTTELREPYAVTGRRLEIRRGPPCFLRYVRRVRNAAEWPALLREVWSWRLAEKIGMSIAAPEMKRLVKSGAEEAYLKLARAKRLDAQHERLPVERPSAEGYGWLLARRF